jgi:hypothetical protein
MSEFLSRVADEHRAQILLTEGATRAMHREKADQFDRLAGKRDLPRSPFAPRP